MNALKLIWIAAAFPGAVFAQMDVVSMPLASQFRTTLPPAGTYGFNGLNLMYDAMPARHAAVLTPQAPKAALAPKSSKRAKAKAAPKRPLPELRLIVPSSVPAMQQRTFKILLSQPAKTDAFDNIILRYAKMYDLNPRLVKSIVAAESEFFWMAVSPRGARGLMQVMPATAEEMGVSGRQLFDPEQNIKAGAAYLNRLFRAAFRRFHIQGVRIKDAPLWLVQRVVAAYNAGPRFISQDGWFAQTRLYVRKVLLFYGSKVSEMRRRNVAPMLSLPPHAGLLY